MQKLPGSADAQFIDTDCGETLTTYRPKTFEEWRDSRIKDPRTLNLRQEKIKGEYSGQTNRQ